MGAAHKDAQDQALPYVSVELKMSRILQKNLADSGFGFLVVPVTHQRKATDS